VETADLDLFGLHDSLSSPIFESMTFLNEVAHRFPDAISFAAGRPYEGFFDTVLVHDYLRTFRDHLTAKFDGDQTLVRRTMLQYGPTKGIINDLVASHLAVDEHIDASPESIVVTVGCQEAMYLTLRALRTDAQDALLTVFPCYVGIAGAAQLAGIPLLPVADSPDGIDLADLERVIRQAKADGLRPRACYVVADFANPSGNSLSMDARERLLQLAEEHDFLILEDNPYGIFHDGTEAPPTLKSLDRHRRVVYLGTFAKSGVAGARVGFAVADQRVSVGEGDVELFADQLSKLKSMLTVNTSPLAQAVIGGKLLAHDFSLRAANLQENRVYQDNRRLLLDGLARRFPPGSLPKVTWNSPHGGFFLVVDLPFEAGDEELEYCAREYGVLWTPMHHFYGDGKPRRQIRLSFSSVSPEEINAGLDRLTGYVRARARIQEIA
jgi:(S)-3,5-dihydroxyphenylglycine transaminase